MSYVDINVAKVPTRYERVNGNYSGKPVHVPYVYEHTSTTLESDHNGSERKND